MKIALTLLFLLLLGLGVSAYGQTAGKTEVFVAPGGDDDNPGTAEKPLATLQGARDTVRRLKQRGLTQPVDVVLREGTYYLTEPLVLDPRDSGTEAYPITYRAAEGARVVISGGVPIEGWSRREGNVWATKAPTGHEFRLMRVGEEWAIRARYPNYDPKNPYTGGWLFADFGGEPWERGQFGLGVSNIHNVNDRLTWRIRVPADGRYLVWVRYGHKMTTYGVQDMGRHSALQVDSGGQVLLENLPDTGGWDQFRWSRAAVLTLTAGEHELSWVNLKGGGLNLDAFVLCDEETWTPETNITDFTWWGAYTLKPPGEDKHVLVIQAEACDKAEGPEIQVPRTAGPGTKDSMRFREGTLPQFADLHGAEVHIFIAWGWVNAIIPIESIDHATRQIRFAGGDASQDVRMGNRYFIENVREALDAPGEWYLDAEKGEVLYIADRPEFPEVPVVMAVLDRLIVLEGDPAAGHFVENVNFEGLRFADTTYNLTKDYYTPQDAAVVLSGARNCTVRGCEFAWLGGYACKLTNLSERCVFLHNNVHHLGQGGVILVGGTKVQPHHCEVIGNAMHHLGLIYKHVAGVYGVHGSDNRVAHNLITDVPRYALSFKSQGEERLSHRNVIEFNEIRRCNLETNDTGAIETLGYERRDSGNVVRHNLILDSVGLGTTAEGEILTPYFTWGVYLDDYSSGTTIYGNIIARTMSGGVCIHGGQNNVVENNIFVDGHDHQVRLQPRDDFMKGNRFERNLVVYSRPEADLVFSWRASRDLFAVWDYNLYWLRSADLRTLERRVTPEGTFAQWLAAGYDEHSIVADPRFVDAEHDDYRLKPDSPAFTLGFKAIPVEKIGPKGLED